jgi:hypothetical protein
MSINNLEFTVHDFKYTIKFYDESLYIIAEHEKEFHKWSYIFSNDCGEASDEIITFKFTSKFLYKILHDYFLEKLDKNIEIIFPDKIKDPWMALPITINLQLITKISKLITLEYVKTDNQDRLQKMVLQLRDQVKQLNKIFIVDIPEPNDDNLSFYFQDQKEQYQKIEKNTTIDEIINMYGKTSAQQYILIIGVFSINIEHLNFKNNPILLSNGTFANPDHTSVNNKTILIRLCCFGYSYSIDLKNTQNLIEMYIHRYEKAKTAINYQLNAGMVITNIITREKDRKKLVLLSTD